MRTIQRDIVGAFIFSSDNYFLVGKNKKGGVYADVWAVPGGGMDEGESKEEALRREVMEETGLDISGSELVPMPSDTGTSVKTLKDTGETVNVEMTFYNYKVTMPVSHTELVPQPSDDLEDVHWVTLEQLKDMPFSPPAEKCLKALGAKE